MKLNETAKGCIGAITFMTVFVGWLYWDVSQQHKFAITVAEDMESIPVARLVSSFKSSELTNPFSWFWPPMTRLTYAAPDTSLPGGSRFYLMTFVLDNKDPPFIMMVHVNCESQKYIYYATIKPTDSIDRELARNVLGEPVIAPDGSMFQRHETKIPADPSQLKTICETDWTKERKAISGRYQRLSLRAEKRSPVA